MKTIFGVLLIVLSLSGCEEQSTHLVPVGTKLPGGFVVNESQLFETMKACKAHADTRLEEHGVEVIGDTNTQTLYTRAFLREDNRQGLQVCQVRGNKNVLYSSAIK